MGVLIAAPAAADMRPDSIGSISLSAAASLQTGQLIAYQYRGIDYGRQWLQEAKLRFGIGKTLSPHWSALASIEGTAWYSTYHVEVITNNPRDFPEQYFSLLIHQAEAVFSIGDPLRLEFGIFPFKYDPEVRNLGEYLFRSGAYPGFLIGEFDFPLTRLTGIHAGSRLFGTLSQDMIVNMETDFKPFHDVSMSYLAALTPHPVVTIGGGVNFTHLISVDETATTPRAAESMYIDNPDTLKNALGNDSIVGDTVRLTFRGIKLMGRIALDIKQLFPHDFFGPEDLKLYGEAAVLGLQNYALYYDTLWQRIPVMAGINIPTFKLLDVLSLEAQYYGFPYPNSYMNAFSIKPPPEPIPDGPAAGYSNDIYRKDNWKWSVYARKTIGAFSITAQAARDHFRTKSYYNQYREFEEALTKDNQWYWMLKFAYGF
jgi:hypothetical protein